MPLTLRADSDSTPKQWVGGSHAVHTNIWGHSGGCMSLGRSMTINTSTNKNLKTRSSTNTELAAAYNFMPIILWTNYFLSVQGYSNSNMFLYQENKSAILLDKNGKILSSKRTKHINIRFYFITDRINNEELSVEYCPT